MLDAFQNKPNAANAGFQQVVVEFHEEVRLKARPGGRNPPRTIHSASPPGSSPHKASAFSACAVAMYVV
jgi:hypothetical protein